MNNTLKKEIIHHIFEITGLLKNSKNIRFLDDFLSDKFLIDKKIAFQTDDEKQFSSNIWAAQATVEQSVIKLMIANLSDNVAEEYVLLIQMDNYPPYCMQLCQDGEDNGAFYFCVDKENWIATSTLMQANVLAGIETVADLLPKWVPSAKHEDEYQYILSFLNFNRQ
jgi:hypothetical protein